MTAVRRLVAVVACCILIVPRQQALTVLQSPTALGNLAVGRRIDANSTCGQAVAQVYCTVEDVCGLCDASDPQHAHNATSLNDENGATWWQSIGGDAAVTLELRLELPAYFAAFSASYKSPRPAAAVLERSVDFGQVYTPYQYYAENCSEFGLVDTSRAVSVPGQASCTSLYSDGQAGMIYYNVSTSPGPQAWFYITNIRLRMLQYDTALLQGPAQDQFYAAYELVVEGGCLCHGHATSCVHLDQSQQPNVVPLLCQCADNTTGNNCEQCLPGYYRNEPTNLEQSCVACQCSTEGSQSIQCDPITRQCPCKDGYSGPRCDQCTSGYFRSGMQCLPCNCDPDGTVSCDPGTGTCRCYPGVAGQRCDRCPPNYLGPDRHIVGRCLNCYCNGYSSSCTQAVGWVQAEVVNTFVSGEEMVGWRSIGGVISNNTRFYLEVIASKDAKTVSLEFPKPYLGDKRTAYGQQVEFNVSFPKADVGKNYTVSMEIVGKISRYTYNIVQLNASLVLTYPPPQSFKVTLLPRSFSVFQRVGYFQASEGDVREALASVISMKLTFPASISPLRLTRSRLPYASLSPSTAGLVGGGAMGVRYVENCSSSCPPRRQGEHCGSCTKGYTVDPAYGGEFARCVPCYCSFKSPVCDPMSGVCSSCVNHTDGDFCQNCSPGYTREHWYEQCNQCDGGYWEKEKGVCAACACNTNGSLTNLCNVTTGVCACKVGVVGPKCDLCGEGTTGLFPTCQPCGECASRRQAQVTPLQREVDLLLRAANMSGVYRYTGLDRGILDELQALLEQIESLLASNSIEVDMLTMMAHMTHDRLTNLTSLARLLYGRGVALGSQLSSLEQTSLYVLGQTASLKQRLDLLQVGFDALSNESSAILGSTVDWAPLLQLARDALLLSNQSQQLVTSNVTALLSSARGLLISSMDELLQSQFKVTLQRLVATLQNASLELDSMEAFLWSASQGLCNANTTVDCYLCGGVAPCGSLYSLTFGALDASREAWSVARATVKGLVDQLQSFANISLAVGRVNETSLSTLLTIKEIQSSYNKLLLQLQTLLSTVGDELGRSRVNVTAIVQLERDTLAERLPIDQSGFLQILLRINMTASDILAINITLANQSSLLEAANNALTMSNSAWGVATRLANDTAALQAKLTQLGVSLISAHQMSAKTLELASAVTVETSQTTSTLKTVEVVLGKTAGTITNLTLIVADLKAKFAQNADQLVQVSNATVSTELLSTRLLSKVLPAVQYDADVVKNEANGVLRQSQSDLLVSRTLQKRADSLAAMTQNQLLILESYQLTKDSLQQRQQEIQEDVKRLANQIGVLSNQLQKLIAKNTACLDPNTLA